MSNPIGTIFSSFGINDDEITSQQSSWLLGLAYDALSDKCVEDGINLKITRDEFIVEYSLAYAKPTSDSILEYYTKISTAIFASKHDPTSALGFVAPLALPAIIGGTIAVGNVFSRNRYSTLQNDIVEELTKQAGQAVLTKVDSLLSDLAGGILGGGPNKPGKPAPPASGGGGRGETYGGTGSTQPIGANFVNYVHPTKKLEYNLGIPNTLRGTEPFDSSITNIDGVVSSCLTLKVINFKLPLEDDTFNQYYTKVWIPSIRDYLQGEKRLNTNLASLFTPDRMRDYIERVAEALQIYHFFINVFNYNLLGEGLNSNAGLRYIRETMFSTTNLQKLSLLRERLDGLPWPQTLDSEIAYHGFIYTQSDVNYSGNIMNVPDIFVSNLYQTGDAPSTTVIDSIRADVIQSTIDKLDFTDLTTGDNRANMLKMIGGICNTTDFQNSKVSSIQIEPFTDPVFNTEFVNNSLFYSTVSDAGSVSRYNDLTLICPQEGAHDYSPVPFYSYTNDVPGMLQATWTAYKNTGGQWNGFWRPVTNGCVLKTSAPEATVFTVSNVMFFCDEVPNYQLIDSSGSVTLRGGFVHVTPATQNCWLSNNFVEYPCINLDDTTGQYVVSKKTQKPYGSQLIVNMSVQTNFNQRTQYWKQIMESAGWAMGRTEDRMISSPKRTKRYGKDKSEDKEE
uniref:Uncharacterized protein n=1 Tax=viral metagenome TaxID=1070528 RepID=A0A2V0RB25_9ZZZZ